MIFVKSVLGGVVTVVLAWIVVVTVFMLRAGAARKQQGISGLSATAGGWNYLLQTPFVLLLLTVAFGLGLYVTSRWSLQ